MNHKNASSKFLENRRFIFLEIGMILTLSVVLVAFNFKSTQGEPFLQPDQVSGFEIDQDIVITRHKLETPPPPPPPPIAMSVVNIVDNSELVETDLTFSSEDDQMSEAFVYTPAIPDESPEPEPEPMVFPEQQAAFPGGETARMDFIQRYIKYPQKARELGIQGTVYLTFVVEKDGSVTDVRILRGIGGGCDEEAIRVIHMMPKWNPGLQINKPVRVQFNMPIKFTLHS
jgi:protein TonB